MNVVTTLIEMIKVKLYRTQIAVQYKSYVNSKLPSSVSVQFAFPKGTNSTYNLTYIDKIYVDI